MKLKPTLSCLTRGLNLYLNPRSPFNLLSLPFGATVNTLKKRHNKSWPRHSYRRFLEQFKSADEIREMESDAEVKFNNTYAIGRAQHFETKAMVTVYVEADGTNKPPRYFLGLDGLLKGEAVDLEEFFTSQ